jgi:hypothetical protein
MRARGTVHVATRRFHVCRRTQCDERVLRYNGANPSEMPVAAGSVFTPTRPIHARTLRHTKILPIAIRFPALDGMNTNRRGRRSKT